MSSLEPFGKSAALSLGVELELQLVNTHDYDLAPYAEDMLRLMKKIPLPGAVVPEMTSSMIEISTGVCRSSSEVLGQLSQIRDALVKSADKLNIAIVGGGTHPYQAWHERRIYDKPRFRELSELYGYLSKLLASTCMWAARMQTPRCSRCTACRATFRTLLRCRRPARTCRGKTRRLTRPGSTQCLPSPCRAAHRLY